MFEKGGKIGWDVLHDSWFGGRWTTHCNSSIRLSSRSLQNWPELLPWTHGYLPLICFSNSTGKFYLINSPWGFSTIWNVVKRWLDPVTVDKISILGSSYQSTLLEQIPAENLPSQFGGKCRCPGGCELSDEGPWKDPRWLGLQEKAVPTAEPVKSEYAKPTSNEPSIHGSNPEARDADGAALQAA